MEGRIETTPSERIADAIEDLAIQVIEERREDRRWAAVKRSALILGAIAGLALYLVLHGPLLGNVSDPDRPSVAIIPIQGVIGPDGASADRIVPLLDRACRTEAVHAVVLRITSPGGSPSEAERIAAAINRCSKPVTAVIDGMAASAAYLFAIHADHIVANRYGTVGSVGAVMRTLDASQLAERAGLRERVYASSPLKAGASLLSAPGDQHPQAMQALVEQVGSEFAAEVRRKRGERLQADVIDDGRLWIAGEALAIGLIDEVAVLEDYLAAAYPELPVHTYTVQPSLQERLSLESVVDRTIQKLEARLLMGEWR